jgi:hypothetical protein
MAGASRHSGNTERSLRKVVIVLIVFSRKNGKMFLDRRQIYTVQY